MLLVRTLAWLREGSCLQSAIPSISRVNVNSQSVRYEPWHLFRVLAPVMN